MEITEYAKSSKIPLDILKLMVRKKLINNPLMMRIYADSSSQKRRGDGGVICVLKFPNSQRKKDKLLSKHAP